MTGECERAGIVAYIGLGANLNDPADQVRSARRSLSQHPELQEVACSRLYRSMPMGPSGQPDYVNAVVAVRTALPPLTLLRILQDVENQHGRVRTGEQWGPRTLDLDLLLYGDESCATDLLTIPHPGIAEREFVLQPLFEIAPDLTVPGLGPVRSLLQNCPRRTSPLIPLDDRRD